MMDTECFGYRLDQPFHAEQNLFQRGKRQFPDLKNRASTATVRFQGRRFVPHGYGAWEDYRPHVRHIQPQYSNNDPDKRLSLRLMHTASSERDILSTREYRPCYHGQTWISRTNLGTDEYRAIQKYFIHGNANDIACNSFTSKMSDTDLMSDKTTPIHEPWKRPEVQHQRFFPDKRNGIPEATLGDKCYRRPEGSAGFHREGSTLPVVNFGGKPQEFDTFIAVVPQTDGLGESFIEKENKRQKTAEEEEVIALDRWTPAPPLICPVVPKSQYLVKLAAAAAAAKARKR